MANGEAEIGRRRGEAVGGRDIVNTRICASVHEQAGRHSWLGQMLLRWRDLRLGRDAGEETVASGRRAKLGNAPLVHGGRGRGGVHGRESDVDEIGRHAHALARCRGRDGGMGTGFKCGTGQVRERTRSVGLGQDGDVARRRLRDQNRAVDSSGGRRSGTGVTNGVADVRRRAKIDHNGRRGTGRGVKGEGVRV